MFFFANILSENVSSLITQSLKEYIILDHKKLTHTKLYWINIVQDNFEQKITRLIILKSDKYIIL